MGKQTEGDNRERRRRAKQARDAGSSPSAEGVTTGGSKQPGRTNQDRPHDERLAAADKGKQDQEHRTRSPRPRSRNPGLDG